MSTISRKSVRDEIATGLGTALVGTGKPCAAVYNHRPETLGGVSPVVLVLSGPLKRRPKGLGAQKYYGEMNLEIQVLLYRGDQNNPLSDPAAREDAHDDIERLIADWFATHQRGTYYINADYTPEATQYGDIEYLDGEPYSLEVIPVRADTEDV